MYGKNNSFVSIYYDIDYECYLSYLLYNIFYRSDNVKIVTLSRKILFNFVLCKKIILRLLKEIIL